MKDDNRGRDIGKLNRKSALTPAQREELAEYQKSVRPREVMKALEPTIRDYNLLFGGPMAKSEKAKVKLRKLVYEAISLGLEDQLPAKLVEDVGLKTDPNPRVPPEDDTGAPF